MHAFALDIGEALALAKDDPVVAIGVIPHDDGGAFHAAGGGNGEDVHVRSGDGVELPGGVLVNGLDVVVDLHQLDFDVVAVRPLFKMPVCSA